MSTEKKLPVISLSKDYTDKGFILGEIGIVIKSSIETALANLLIDSTLPMQLLVTSEKIEPGQESVGLLTEILSLQQNHQTKQYVVHLKTLQRVKIFDSHLEEDKYFLGYYTLYSDTEVEEIKKLNLLLLDIQETCKDFLYVSLNKQKMSKKKLQEYAYNLSFHIINQISSEIKVNSTLLLTRDSTKRLQEVKQYCLAYVDTKTFSYSLKVKENQLPQDIEEQIISGKLIPLFKSWFDYWFSLPLSDERTKLMFNHDVHCILQYVKLRKEKPCYLLIQSEEDGTPDIGTLAKVNDISAGKINYTGVESDSAKVSITSEASISISLEKVVKVINIQKVGPYQYAEIEFVQCFISGKEAELKELVEQSMELMQKYWSFRKNGIERKKTIEELLNWRVEVADYISFAENICIYIIKELYSYPLPLEAMLLLQELDLLKRFRQIKAQLLQCIKIELEKNSNIKQVKRVPRGYIPTLFYDYFHLVLQPFGSAVVSGYKQEDMTIASEVIKLFYGGKKDWLVIKGEVGNYSPESTALPAIGIHIDNVVLRMDNTLNLYMTSEERYKVSKVIFYKGVYYSKVEKFDELLNLNKEEEGKLKELVNKVVKYYKEEKEANNRLALIPLFNSELMSYQQYAINLSFYIFYNLTDFSARREKAATFCQQDVFGKYDTLLHRLVSNNFITSGQELSDSLQEAGLKEPIQPIVDDKLNITGSNKTILSENTLLTAASSIDQIENRIAALTDGTVEKERALQELSRLKVESNNEQAAVRNYLVQFLNMPWFEKSEEAIDFNKSEEILQCSHFGLEKVKERIIEFLAVVRGAGTVNSPILCLAGPPGVGKTSLAQSIAKAVGRKYACLSLGGVRDEAVIRGHMRTYSNSCPGMIAQLMQRVSVNNPVILLDEIDKTGTLSGRSEIDSALLELLDPKQNKYFTDHYLQVPFDLSNVMFITTANNLDNISLALRDRLEIIKIDGYTDQEKLNISKQYIIPKIISDYGLEKQNINFTDKLLHRIIRGYTKESGVRNLEQNIKTILRKILKKTMETVNNNETLLTEGNLTSYLGNAHFTDSITDKAGYVGKVAGLSYTQYGGNLLFIEAIKTAGEGKIKYTGSLGEVLKESVEIAYSYLKSQAKSLEIDEKEFRQHDIHIHLPEGAIPKDGPSAGVAIYLAMASVITGRIVRPDIAMTGEIDLMGTVMKIGGLKEKLLAAQRGQVKVVIIPESNIEDLTELPNELLEQLKIIGVKTAMQVLNLVLEDKKYGTTQKIASAANRNLRKREKSEYN